MPSTLARVAFTVTALCAMTALAWAEESRVALVIGNGAYVNADSLRNPVNDARGGVPLDVENAGARFPVRE